MKYSLYTVFDKVAEIHNKPFTEVNDATAVRLFSQSLHDNPNKNDYELYLVAAFNDHNAQIAPAPTPKKLLTGFDILKETNQE